MKNATRLKFNKLAEHIAKLNGVPSALTKFSVEPTIQQKLEDAIQASSAFLTQINIVGVDEKSGEKLLLGVNGPIASRTDTSGGGTRNPRDPSNLTGRDYTCVQTNFDISYPYARLDAWAKFNDFQKRVAGQATKRQALDRLMIGWNGTSAAKATDLVANPLLQDVNKGWLQNLREDAPAQVIDTGEKHAGEVRVGPGGDYENLDALVSDAVGSLADWYQEDTGLRCIVGRKLMTDKYFPKINKEQSATDELATQLIVSQKSIGGLQGVIVPFFPANSIFITRPDNLSIYFQNGARRRLLKDEPEKDRMASYESSNDAYVVEDNDLAVLIENIVYGDWSASASASVAPAAVAGDGE